MFLVFGPEVCGILTPQPGIQPTPPALEGKVLTTGPPGKIWSPSFIKKEKWGNWEAQLVTCFAIFWFNIIAQEQAIVCSWAGKQ